MDRTDADRLLGMLETIIPPRQFEEYGGAAWLALLELKSPPPDLKQWWRWKLRELKGADAGEYRRGTRRMRPLTGLDLDRREHETGFDGVHVEN